MRTTYEARHNHPRNLKPGKSIAKAQKRLEAEARQSTYNKLSLQGKIATLIPGGSSKQGMKLLAQMVQEDKFYK